MITDVASYLEAPFRDYEATVRILMRLLRNKRFDTVVATGLSGAIIILPLAKALGKNALLVRKLHDDSHSIRVVEGTLGKRWIFIDDLINTGQTLRRVKQEIEAHVKESANYFPKFKTTFVGAALYHDDMWLTSRQALEYRRS